MDNFNYIKAKTNHVNLEGANYFNREFHNHSETVAKEIIEKLISYTISISYQNDIEKKVPEKCWNYMQKILDDFIHLEYICRDRDDFSLNVESKKVPSIEDNFSQNSGKNMHRLESEMFKGLREKDNFALLNEIDTFENIDGGDNNIMDFGMKYRIKDGFENEIDKNIFFDNQYQGVNEWSILPEPLSSKIDRAAASCVKVTKYAPSCGNPIEEKSEQIYYDTKTNFSRTYQKKATMTFMNNSLNKTNKKPGYSEISDRPIESYRLFFDEEEAAIQELRKTKNEELKKKEEEIKIKEKVEKAIKDKAIENVKKQKELERKNATTDADGKVIFIKLEMAEKFTNDFVNPRCEIKEKGETINYLSNVKSQDKIELYPSAQNLNFFSKKDEKQNEKSTPKRENLKSNSKMKSDNSFHLSSGINDKYYDRGPIIPGGSSYDQIIPEIGVTFYEAGKSKFGGTDYFKAYKKYSHNDYLTILKHTQHNQTTTLKESSTDNTKHKKQQTKNNNIDFTMTLPFINRDNISDRNLNVKTNFGHTTGSLKVSKNYTNFLKTATVNLDSILEKDELLFHLKNSENLKDPKEIIDNPNLFRKSSYNKKEQGENSFKNSLEEINNFNLSIVKNNQWGSNYSKLPKDSSLKMKSNKPDLKEIEREVGKNILNTKLPRSRVFSYVIPPSQMNSTYHKSLKKTK